MKFKSMLFLLVLTSLSSINALYNKTLAKGSQAGKALQALDTFWQRKLSDGLKKECTNQKNCEVLTQCMSNVVAYAAIRSDTTKTAESIDKLFKDTAAIDDIVNAFIILQTYGQAAFENNELKILDKEPTRDIWVPSFFESALQQALEKITEIGKKAQWSEEKIEQEKKQTIEVLNEFLRKNRAKK